MKKFLAIPALISTAFVLGCGGGTSPAPPGVVAVKVNNDGGGQVFFAYQDGSGAWQTASPTISGYVYTYQFNVNDPAGKYGVVVFCSSNLKGYLTHALISESNSLSVDCGTPTHQLSGSVSHSPYESLIYFGPQYWTATTSGNYTLNVPESTHDVIALLDNTTTNNAQIDNIQHVAIYRNVQVAGPTIQNIDFTNAPPADNTSYSWNCIATATHRVSFKSAGGTTIYNIGGASYEPIIPSSLLQPGDLWNYAATDTSGSATTVYEEFHAAPGNYTCSSFPAHMTQGATFNDVDVGQSTQRISISWQAYSSGLNNHNTRIYKLNEYMSGATYYWYMYWTTGWLGNSANYSYTFPNLSGLTGWSDSWYPSEYTQSGRGDWVAYSSNSPTSALFDLFFTGNASDGLEYVTAQYRN